MTDSVSLCFVPLSRGFYCIDGVFGIGFWDEAIANQKLLRWYCRVVAQYCTLENLRAHNSRDFFFLLKVNLQCKCDCVNDLCLEKCVKFKRYSSHRWTLGLSLNFIYSDSASAY